MSVPQFRQDFGYVWQGQPVLPASWQSAFNSVSSIGGMFGGLSLGWISDRLGCVSLPGLCALVHSTVGDAALLPSHASSPLSAS